MKTSIFNIFSLCQNLRGRGLVVASSPIGFFCSLIYSLPEDSAVLCFPDYQQQLRI